MAVAQLVGLRQFRLAEQTIEDPPPGWVQVAVKAIGICGSDMHYFSEGHIGDVPCRYPMVPGHEPAGTILKLGAGVSGWSVGDAAAFEPPLYCYHCEFCIAGLHNLCRHGGFMGSPTEPGYLRDRANIPAVNLLALPPGLGSAEASLFEPISIVLHSMRFIKLTVGETAAVIGAGPIGLSTIAVLRLAGAARIFAIEPLAHRRDMALALGADAAIDPQSADCVAAVLSETHGRGVDAAIDCATRGDTINQALKMARPAGRVVITGVPSELRVPLEFHTLRHKELFFYSVKRSNHTGEAAVRMLTQYPERFLPMITHKRPLSQVQSAFEMIEAYADGVGKVVIEPE